ncbi:MAG: C40 family peptidase [Saezia sp.]
MKKICKLALITVVLSFSSLSAWADRDAISQLLDAQQSQSLKSTESNSDNTPYITAALSSVEKDELDSFLAARRNDYTELLIQDPIGGLLEGEGVFDAGDIRQSIVSAAFNYLNIPYKYGGSNYINGFDCSGLVMAIYNQVANKPLPRTTALQAAATTTIKRSELKPGDLVFFNTIGKRFSHVGIYVGDNKFIHAPSTGAHVRIDSINNRYWNQRFTGARRVVNH